MANVTFNALPPPGVGYPQATDLVAVSPTSLSAPTYKYSWSQATTFIQSLATGTWSISISGTAATVITNANLTGVVTSVGNATAIANGAITNAMLANTAVANLSGVNTGDQSLQGVYDLGSTITLSPNTPVTIIGIDGVVDPARMDLYTPTNTVSQTAGELYWYGQDGILTQVPYGAILVTIDDNTPGNTSGTMSLYAGKVGALIEAIRINGQTGLVRINFSTAFSGNSIYDINETTTNSLIVQSLTNNTLTMSDGSNNIVSATQAFTRTFAGIPTGITVYDADSNYQLIFPQDEIAYVNIPTPGHRMALPTIDTGSGGIPLGEVIRFICPQDAIQSVDIYNDAFTDLLTTIYPGTVLDFYACGTSLNPTGWQFININQNKLYMLTQDINMSAAVQGFNFRSDNSAGWTINLTDPDNCPVGSQFSVYRDAGQDIYIAAAGSVTINGQAGATYKMIDAMQANTFVKVSPVAWQTSAALYEAGTNLTKVNNGDNSYTFNASGAGTPPPSGAYTPVLTNGVGASALAPETARYLTSNNATGNVCICTVQFIYTPTTTSVSILISIPVGVGGNFTAASNASLMGGVSFNTLTGLIPSTYNNCSANPGTTQFIVTQQVPVAAVGVVNRVNCSFSYVIQ